MVCPMREANSRCLNTVESYLIQSLGLTATLGQTIRRDGGKGCLTLQYMIGRGSLVSIAVAESARIAGNRSERGPRKEENRDERMGKTLGRERRQGRAKGKDGTLVIYEATYIYEAPGDKPV